MSQSDPQPSTQWRPGQNNFGRKWGTPFVPETSKTYREERKRRIVEKANELAAELTEKPAKWQMELLLQAAEELTRRPPFDPESRIRRLRVIGQLLRQCGLAHRAGAKALTRFNK